MIQQHYQLALRLQMHVHRALVGVLLKIRQVVAVVLVGVVDDPAEDSHDANEMHSSL